MKQGGEGTNKTHERGGGGGANKTHKQSGWAQETREQLGMNITHKQCHRPDTQRFIYGGGADLRTKSSNFLWGGGHKIWGGGKMFE